MNTELNQKILNDINEIIENERGVVVKPENQFSKSELDSFGYSVFWLEMEKRYPNVHPKKIMERNFQQGTVQELIDYVASQS